MFDDNSLGKRIKQLRRANRMTVEAFAEKVDISVSFLQEIERGNKKPSLPTFVRIANALHASSDSLLCDSIDTSVALKLEHNFNKYQSLSKEQLSLIEAVTTAMLKEFGK